MKLSERLALGIHVESGELFEAAEMIGAPQYAVTLEWAEIERHEGVFTYDRDDRCMERVLATTNVPPYARTFLAPAWVAPHIPPLGDPNAPYVPFLPKANIGKWQAALDKTLSRYHNHLQLIGVDAEINDRNFWVGTPEEFANNVIIPAAEVIHQHNMAIVAPGITIQKFESAAHYARAKDCMTKVLALSRSVIDYIGFHSYGKSAKRVINQIVTFCNETGIADSKIMLTETGFTENRYWVGEDFWNSIFDLFRSGQERQLNRYKTFVNWLEKDAWADRLLNVGIYRGFDTREDPKETHGLTKPTPIGYILKLAGKFLREEISK